MSLCEVRIPTYKRPDLLRRALSSLVEQSYPNWQAIVFDDSPEKEAQNVVSDFEDNRILYKPNEKNLGGLKNIDYAFSSKGYLGGTYAFVLEDDNYLFPDFIAENIHSLETNRVGIVLRNQEIGLEKYGDSVPTGETTRGLWFEQGIYTPFEIHARLFFNESISNGGLFWHTGKIRSNLQVGSQAIHFPYQEILRAWLIKEPIYFEAKPLCVFTGFYREKNNDEPLHSRFYRRYKSLMGAPQHNRGTQAILKHLIDTYGTAIVQESRRLAIERDEERTFERQLLSVRYLNYQFRKLNRLEIARYLITYGLRYYLFKNPLKNFLTTVQSQESDVTSYWTKQDELSQTGERSSE
ncbi:MAG: glycosyltransferase [Myxacorys californica WJT36-NPBG1]|jgi:glycosyltransferase involved in cell wall biosynthesis|nr:glycosyltransferase [Myxacorys californica WJT36-NPBG1]